MYKDNERFWNSSVDDIKKGYSEDDNSYTCLICNKKFIKGRIYKYVDELYDAKKSVEIHIQKEHKSMLEYLLSMNSSFTGLSAVQTEIIKMFAQNISDKEIATKLDVAQSTIRNHRYKLREKEKQAKIFLSIMQLLSEDTKEGINILDNGFICDAHKTATTLDDRFNITDVEKTKVKASYFNKDGTLKNYPSKEKKKIIILEKICESFEKNKNYNEQQVNEIIERIYKDYATVRRALIEYGFLGRSTDCSVYYLKI